MTHENTRKRKQYYPRKRPPEDVPMYPFPTSLLAISLESTLKNTPLTMEFNQTNYFKINP